MKNLILVIVGIYILASSVTFMGCKKRTPEEVKREKDSLERVEYDELIKELIDTTFFNRLKDSTDIYGTGNFDYTDTLESYHRGYSIPRDSLYKVWNTKGYKEFQNEMQKMYQYGGSLLDRGNHWQNIKFYREAITDYNEYIAGNQFNHSAYMNRGNAYERLKIYDSAMWDYQKVLELKPDDTIANFNKGNVHDILSRYDKAVMEYDTVVMKDPRLAKGYYNRGTTYLAMRKFKEAARDWEQAILLNKTYEAELRPRLNKLISFINRK